MAKLKGVRKLNKSIGMAFRGFGIDKMFLDTEYAYYFAQVLCGLFFARDGVYDKQQLSIHLVCSF